MVSSSTVSPIGRIW